MARLDREALKRRGSVKDPENNEAIQRSIK